MVDALLEMAKAYSGDHFFRPEGALPRFDEDVPLAAMLGEVKVPVVVMVGERDDEQFHQIARRVWEEVPHRWGDGPIIVPGAGHFAVLENPRFVAETAVRFWDAVQDGIV